MAVMKVSHLLVTLFLQLLSVDVRHTAVEAFVSVGPNLQRSYRKAADSELTISGRTDDRCKSPYLLFPGGG
jgi:hypothetical protein